MAGNEKTDNAVAELIRSTAKIKFSELQRFFAQGVMYVVAKEVDLIEVATKMIADDKDSIEELIEDSAFKLVQDEQAREWLNDDTMLWCTVVAPYILVQEFEDDLQYEGNQDGNSEYLQ